jgi:predicted ATPase
MSLAASLARLRTEIPDNDLMMLTISKLAPLIPEFIRAMGSARLYQLDPELSREDGEKATRPEMTFYGANLPSVLYFLQQNAADSWRDIQAVMKSVAPQIEEVLVSDSATGNLGIFFREFGYSRAWNASEVSDGTMRALALAAAIFDPRISLLILEEPENSVHPWIARLVVNACIAAASQKQVILTTHSSVIMNSVRPDDVVLVWHDAKGTHSRPVPDMDKSVRAVLDSGDMDVFDILVGGSLPQAVPSAAVTMLGDSD